MFDLSNNKFTELSYEEEIFISGGAGKEFSRNGQIAVTIFVMLVLLLS